LSDSKARSPDLQLNSTAVPLLVRGRWLRSMLRPSPLAPLGGAELLGPPAGTNGSAGSGRLD